MVNPKSPPPVNIDLTVVRHDISISNARIEIHLFPGDIIMIKSSFFIEFYNSKQFNAAMPYYMTLKSPVIDTLSGDADPLARAAPIYLINLKIDLMVWHRVRQ